MKDVTNSPKDVHDFWYNSEEIEFIRLHTEDNNDGP